MCSSDLTLMNPQTKKSSTLVVDATSEDFWIKSGSSWKEKSSKNLTSKQTLDGQSFKAPGE